MQEIMPFFSPVFVTVPSHQTAFSSAVSKFYFSRYFIMAVVIFKAEPDVGVT